MEKCAAIVIRDRRLLVVRKRGTEMFISPGGKIEPGETQLQCLRRELLEEVGAEPRREAFFGTFERPAAFDDAIIVIHAWTADLDGPCRACSEIEEVRWIDGTSDVPLGSVIAECILPALVEQGAVDG